MFSVDSEDDSPPPIESDTLNPQLFCVFFEIALETASLWLFSVLLVLLVKLFVCVKLYLSFPLSPIVPPSVVVSLCCS